MFVIEKEMRNGAIARYHKAVRFEVHPDVTHAVVNSYHREEMVDLSWTDTYVIPSIIQITSLWDVEHVLVAPGAPFDGGEVIDPAAGDLAVAKARKWAEIKMIRTRLLNGGCMTPLGKADITEESLTFIGGAVQMAQLALAAGTPFSRMWKMFDNTRVAHDAQQMVDLGVAVGSFIGKLWDASGELEELLGLAETVEDVMGIDAHAGWPDPEVLAERPPAEV